MKSRLAHRETALEFLVPPSLAIYFVAVATATVSARYATASVVVLAAIWTLFSLALFFGARWLQGRGRVAGLAGAFAVCSAALWHLREQTFVPGPLWLVPLLAAAGAPLYLLVVERLLAPPRRRLAAVLCVAAGLAFAGLFAGAFEGSALLRWHLLRHNTMLGTPAYYLLEAPTAERERELFARPRDGGGGAAPPPGAATAGPDVVFILLDTLRADALAAWGADPAPMPNLDRFLEGAYRFTDVVANSSWTRPSMASFFTGLLPEEHGARDLPDTLGDEHLTLAERLRERGYRTAAFMTNVAALGEGTGFSQGFDLYYEFEAKPYARAAAVNRAAIGWLADLPGATEAAPLFLYLHYLDPHEPYLSGDEPAAKRAADYLRAYRAELAYLDRELGRLLEDLVARLPGAVIFITSDHGEEFFEHELFGHGHSLYEELIHVPAALWTAGGEGKDLEESLEARDFFDLLDRLASGEELDVAGWARGRSRQSRYASVYYSQTGRLALRPYLAKTVMQMVAENDRKLIWSAYGDTRELYDLSADRGETRNLAAARAGETARLTAALAEHPRFWTFSEPFQPSGEALDQLRDLGYLD